ncbi:MAG: phosphomethylpyrimidine synthase ThiC [Dictyoglomaceae bacterium]
MEKTILEKAKEGIKTIEMELSLKNEEISIEKLISNIASGKTVIPANKGRKRDKYFAIGKDCTVKINANIGVTADYSSFDMELKKAELCEKYGVESVMDLSCGKYARSFKEKLLKDFSFVVGSVPVYDLFVRVRNFTKAKPRDFLEVLEEHVGMGIDFVTIHAGLNRELIEKIKNSQRILKIVSRGGSMIYKWMVENNEENPYYEYFDDVLKILKKYDAVISIGDALRPGCIFDSTDPLQIEETIVVSKLAKRARDYGVQVIIEGPGHMRADEIPANVKIIKKLCDDAPLYVLGPLTTDISAGYDHIAGSMGALISALSGADFLCYVTPAEHLRLPDVEDVKEGIIAFKIAAHSANLVRGFKSALNKDFEMSKARKDLNWERMIECSIDPDKARRYRENLKDVCSMCGELCAIKNSR